MALPHTQSAWGSKGKRVQATRLAAYYNYLKITNAAAKRVGVEEKAEEIKFDFKLKGFDESSHLVAAQPAAAATLN